MGGLLTVNKHAVVWLMLGVVVAKVVIPRVQGMISGG
jgi:hypothetical protein